MTVVRLLAAQRALRALKLKAPTTRSPSDTLLLWAGGMFLAFYVSRRYGGYLDLSAGIGQDAFFLHGLHGVFIGGGVKIGDRAMICHHVTIGGAGGKPDRIPVIGNDVVIEPNATIIGRCIIGDGAKIGAGVTLVDAVIPPGAVIINKSAYNLTEGKPVYS